MNLIERYLNDDPDLQDVPLPEIIITYLNGTMMSIDQSEDKRLYCVRDWVYWLSESKAKDHGKPWRDLKPVLKKDYPKAVENLDTLSVPTLGGPQIMDFTDAQGLYSITQRMSDRSPTVVHIKQYLARAGVIVDEIRRDPEKATDAVMEGYRRKGRDEQWIQTRLAGQIAREQFIHALNIAIAEQLQSTHYSAATNEIYLGLWERTAAVLKQQLGLSKSANLRDNQPRLALMYQMIAEETASIELGDAPLLTWNQAKSIVRNVAEFIGRQARATSERLGIDLATGKPLLKRGR